MVFIIIVIDQIIKWSVIPHSSLWFRDYSPLFARSSQAVQNIFETVRTPKFDHSTLKWVIWKVNGSRRTLTIEAVLSGFVVVSQVVFDTTYMVNPSVPIISLWKPRYIKNQCTLISQIKYFVFISEFCILCYIYIYTESIFMCNFKRSNISLWITASNYMLFESVYSCNLLLKMV